VWTDYPLVIAGVETALLFEISYWDGAIIAAAERLGASTLYTEDLNHSQHYGSVQAINPFLPGDPDGVHEDPESPYGR
jgi:predicted nucleic acid-binding protein